MTFQGYHVTVEGAVVQEAQNRPLEEERIRKQMMKTGETEFAFESLDIYMGEGIFLPMQQLNELRRNALEKLRQKVLAQYRRSLSEAAKQQIHCKQQEMTGWEENPAEELSASVITKQQLEAVLKVPEITRVYADCGMFRAETFREEVLQAVTTVREKGKTLYLTLPHIVRDRELNGRAEAFAELAEAGLGGFLVRNLETFGTLKRLGLEKSAVLDANLYTMNNESRKFWKNQGSAGDTVPLELNQKELRFRQNTGSEMMVYGYIPMMVSVQCVQKNLDKCNRRCEVLTLKDRYQKEFHAVCNCEFCYNTIYNSLPMSLLKEAETVRKLGISRYRLSFTLENGEQTEKIARGFAEVYKNGRQPDAALLQMETTKGHFGRGVE